MRFIPCITGFCVVILLAACSEKQMPEEWCEQMMEKPNKEWQGDDYTLFANSCIPEDEQ